MALTDATLRNLKPKEKAFKIADSGGLHIFVSPAGGRLWRFKYRIEGKERLLSLGAYPLIGLKAARDARDDAKRLLLAGKDPSAVKREAFAVAKPEPVAPMGPTFFDMAKEHFNKLNHEGRAFATLKKNKWLIDFALADFGNRQITEIDAATVLACLRKLEKRGRYESTRRLRALISAIFRHAIASSKATVDPTYALAGALIRPQVTPRAAITEQAAFGRLLRAIWNYDGTPEVNAALKLAALLYQRPGELRQAQWREFDFEKLIWTIPAVRTKTRREHRVPLPSSAVDILKELRSARITDELVFPSKIDRYRPISDGTLNAALRRLGFEKTVASAHGFRASFATLANESGLWHPDAIERALAHVETNSVRRVYARGQFWEERVRMADWWQVYCEDLRKAAAPKNDFADLLGV